MTDRRGMALIPTGARFLAGFVFMAIVALFFWLFDSHEAVGFETAMGLGIGTVAATFILLAGYVYADASRRGMPPLPWLALTVLVPNGVGFVIYFVLRKPIVHPCSKCGHGVDPVAAFCSRCGQSQQPNAGI